MEEQDTSAAVTAYCSRGLNREKAALLSSGGSAAIPAQRLVNPEAVDGRCKEENQRYGRRQKAESNLSDLTFLRLTRESGSTYWEATEEQTYADSRVLKSCSVCQ